MISIGPERRVRSTKPTTLKSVGDSSSPTDPLADGKMGYRPMNRRNKRRFALASTGVLLAGLGGCVVGNNSKLQRPTIGQELIDLQRARDSGAIDEAEYLRTRTRILESAGVPPKQDSDADGSPEG